MLVELVKKYNRGLCLLEKIWNILNNTESNTTTWFALFRSSKVMTILFTILTWTYSLKIISEHLIYNQSAQSEILKVLMRQKTRSNQLLVFTAQAYEKILRHEKVFFSCCQSRSGNPQIQMHFYPLPFRGIWKLSILDKIVYYQNMFSLHYLAYLGGFASFIWEPFALTHHQNLFLKQVSRRFMLKCKVIHYSNPSTALLVCPKKCKALFC